MLMLTFVTRCSVDRVSNAVADVCLSRHALGRCEATDIGQVLAQVLAQEAKVHSGLQGTDNFGTIMVQVYWTFGCEILVSL
jgi:hypothetical protein